MHHFLPSADLFLHLLYVNPLTTSLLTVWQYCDVQTAAPRQSEAYLYQLVSVIMMYSDAKNSMKWKKEYE